MTNYGMSMNYTHFSLPNLQRKMLASEIPVKYLRYKASYKSTLRRGVFSNGFPVERNCVLYIEPPSKFFHPVSEDDPDFIPYFHNVMIYPDENFTRSRYKPSAPGRFIPQSPDWDYKLHLRCYSVQNQLPFFYIECGFHLFEFVDNTLDTANYGIKVFNEVLLNNKVYKPLESIKCGNMFDLNFERYSNTYKDRRVACLMPLTTYYYDDKKDRSVITPLIIDTSSGTSFRTLLVDDFEQRKLAYMPSYRRIQSGEIYLDIIDVSHLPSFDEIPSLE